MGQKSVSDIIRSRSIAVSHEVYWMLRILSKAQRSNCGPLDSPEGPDAIGERILREYLAAKHPDLVVLWARRGEVDDEAVKLCQKP